MLLKDLILFNILSATILAMSICESTYGCLQDLLNVTIQSRKDQIRMHEEMLEELKTLSKDSPSALNVILTEVSICMIIYLLRLFVTRRMMYALLQRVSSISCGFRTAPRVPTFDSLQCVQSSYSCNTDVTVLRDEAIPSPPDYGSTSTAIDSVAIEMDSVSELPDTMQPIGFQPLCTVQIV